MANKKHPLSTHCPYHVSARCINREWFGLEPNEVWPIMVNYLYFIQKAYDVRIIAFVLMSNHFHLLIRTPHANLSEAMNYFMRETSRAIAERTNRINHIYGARYHRTLIESNRYFFCAYKYVYRNPDEAGICDRVENYRFSTLRGLLGLEHLLLPVEEDLTLFSGVEETLLWLNKPPPKENYDYVRAALRKPSFKLPNSKKRNQPNPLENLPY